MTQAAGEFFSIQAVAVLFQYTKIILVKKKYLANKKLNIFIPKIILVTSWSKVYYYPSAFGGVNHPEKKL